MATISGTILRANGTPLPGATVQIETVSAPVVSGAAVVSRSRLTVEADVAGTFTVDLAAGDYVAAWVNTEDGNSKSEVKFAVPAGVGTYRWESLFTSALTYTYTAAPNVALKAPPSGGYRITAAGLLQVWNSTEAKFQTVSLVGPANAPRWAFGPVES